MSAYNTILGAWPGELDLSLDAEIKGKLPEMLVGGTFWSNGPGRILVKIGRAHV